MTFQYTLELARRSTEEVVARLGRRPLGRRLRGPKENVQKAAQEIEDARLETVRKVKERLEKIQRLSPRQHAAALRRKHKDASGPHCGSTASHPTRAAVSYLQAIGKLPPESTDGCVNVRFDFVSLPNGKKEQRARSVRTSSGLVVEVPNWSHIHTVKDLSEEESK